MKMTKVSDVLRQKMKRRSFAKMFNEERMKLEIAHQLAEARQKHHFSQTMVAKKMGVAPQVVSRMEKGSLNLTLRSIFKYARSINEPVNITIGRRV